MSTPPKANIRRKPRTDLTPAQTLALAAVRSWWSQIQTPPTQTELAEVLLISVVATHKHLRRLQDAGMVTWRKWQPGIYLTDKGKAYDLTRK